MLRPFAGACYELLNCIFIDLTFETTTNDFFYRVRQGLPELLALGPEEDLEEKKRVVVGYGTEASVYGKKGFDELDEFSTQGSGKGYARVDAKGSQPEEIQLCYPPINDFEGTGD